MGQKSLGLIETIGLTAGIEAADAAVKSANVELVGYELTRGDGMTTIKIEGDVGAVKAAVEAARIAAAKVNAVFSSRVIARPARDIEYLIRNRETVGYQPPEPPADPPPKAKAPPEPPPPAPEPPAEETAQAEAEAQKSTAQALAEAIAKAENQLALQAAAEKMQAVTAAKKQAAKAKKAAPKSAANDQAKNKS